jgi:hypothetical protein
MFVANHALTEASASGPTVSDARRRGPVLRAVTMAAIRNGAAPGRVSDTWASGPHATASLVVVCWHGNSSLPRSANTCRDKVVQRLMGLVTPAPDGLPRAPTHRVGIGDGALCPSPGVTGTSTRSAAAMATAAA